MLELHELSTHAGIVELLAGDAVAAEALLRSARDGFAGAHAGGDLKTTIGWLGVRAEALALTGQVEEALELVQRAVSLAESDRRAGRQGRCEHGPGTSAGCGRAG